MAFALMAWVWIGLILAQRNKAGSHRYAQGRLGSQEAFGAAPQEWTDRSSYVAVWNFLQGANPLLTLSIGFDHVKIELP